MDAQLAENRVVVTDSASAMPAPTWHRLKSNSAEIAIPAGLDVVSVVEVESNNVEIGSADLFDGHMRAYQEKLDAAPTPVDERAVLVAAQGLAADDNLDVPALSAYQRKAALQEKGNSVINAFETGMGNDVHAFLAESAQSDGAPLVLHVTEGQKGSAVVRIPGVAASLNAVAIDVVLDAQATLDVTLSYEAEEKASGIAGVTLRVFGDASSKLTLDTIQTMPDTWTVFDDSGFVLADDASASITHRVLGAGKAYTGLAADLRGECSSIDTSTRYIGYGKQQRDFNYTVRHRGRDTKSNLIANGVLAGESQKTLRGTIDLIHGCKGAEGNERETVLLADDRVGNRTVPVILCDEDDVAGNHGATIGHVRPEQLFYLTCRGLSEEAVEHLFFTSAFEETVLSVDDERIREGVVRLAQQLGTPIEDCLD